MDDIILSKIALCVALRMNSRAINNAGNLPTEVDNALRWLQLRFVCRQREEVSQSICATLPEDAPQPSVLAPVQ